MTRITKMAPLFEGFVQEKEYSAILENINESVDTEIVEKYKTLSTEKEAAEAINELIDKKVSLEEFFATMSELKQGFKPKSGTELSDELTKALNRMTDTYKLLSEKNREIGKRIVEKIKGKPKAAKASKVNESEELNEGAEADKEWLKLVWNSDDKIIAALVAKDKKDLTISKGELADLLETELKKEIDAKDLNTEVLTKSDFIEEYDNADNPNRISYSSFTKIKVGGEKEEEKKKG